VRKYRFDVFAAVWVPYALLVRYFWFITDDAFISFRYARNLVLGNGLRFNPGERVPVEGYSNFLWVMVCAVFEFLRIDITLWPLLVSFACGSLLLWLVFDILRRRLELSTTVAALATLTLGCFPPFALWSSSGLETMPFALLVFVTFERLVLRRESPDGVGAGTAGLLLALIRIEGIAWVAVILILAIVSRRIPRQRCLRPLVVCALTVGIGYAVYFGWRYSYYDVLLPNTAYVKADLDATLLMRGVNYVVSFALAFLTPMLIVPGSFFALRRGRIAVGLPIAAMAWAFPAYAIVVTGDFMVMGRFLIPGLAFNTVLLAWMLNDLWSRSWARRAVTIVATVAIIAVSLLPGLPPRWNLHVVPRAARERFRFRFNAEDFKSELEQWQAQNANAAEWTRRGKALKSYVQQRQFPEPHPSYVAGAIGANGYYSDLYIFDKHGLVTPEVARRSVEPGAELRSPGHDKGVPTEYFLKDRPTILLATVVQTADPRAVLSTCMQQAQALRLKQAQLPALRDYVVDFARVPCEDSAEQQYIVTWTRIAAGVELPEAWAELERRLSALQAEEAPETPGPVPQPARPW
jgi:arabinofuranosyltransferase